MLYFHLDCGSRPADIYFLLDASGSVYSSGFRKQLDFVEAFANKFDVGPDAVRIGVSTFADDVQSKFWMNEHMDRAGLLRAISDVGYSRGSVDVVKYLLQTCLLGHEK